MSLIPPRKGNPKWVKGVAQNPAGRPKGSSNVSKEEKVKDRLKLKNRNPLDELISIADNMRFLGKFEEAAKIWLEIQKYCEPTKKPVETAPEKPLTPEQSKENVEEMLKLLEEASEDNGQQTEGSSNSDSLATGQSEIQTETRSKENPSEPSGE